MSDSARCVSGDLSEGEEWQSGIDDFLGHFRSPKKAERGWPGIARKAWSKRRELRFQESWRYPLHGKLGGVVAISQNVQGRAAVLIDADFNKIAGCQVVQGGDGERCCNTSLSGHAVVSYEVARGAVDPQIDVAESRAVGCEDDVRGDGVLPRLLRSEA